MAKRTHDRHTRRQSTAAGGFPSYTYNTIEKTRIRVSGQRARLSHLRDRGDFKQLKVGDSVTIEYHLNGHDRIAERIAIYPSKK